MKLNAQYEESFNLKAQEAFQTITIWLLDQKANIKKNETPVKIEANHGSLFKTSAFNPKYKKRIKINIKEIEDNKITVFIESQPIAATGTSSNDNVKINKRWFNEFFQFLFVTLHKKENKDMSISENEKFQYNKNPEKILKNPEYERAKYKKRIIRLSIITIFLFFLTYVPFLGFHLILIGSDLIIPGGISFGWVTFFYVIYNIIKYLIIEEE